MPEDDKNENTKRPFIDTELVRSWLAIAAIFVAVGMAWANIKGELRLLSQNQTYAARDINEVKTQMDDIVRKINANTARVRDTEANLTQLWRQLEEQRKK